MTIAENVRQILAELPAGVKLVAAAKTRSPQEILEAIEAGITDHRGKLRPGSGKCLSGHRQQSSVALYRAPPAKQG